MHWTLRHVRFALIGAMAIVSISMIPSLHAQRGRGAPAQPPAPPLTLEAKLIPVKDTYTITAEQTGEQFRQRIRATGRGAVVAMPAPPEVDLTLELKNTGTMPVTFAVDSDASYVTLALAGPGAITADSNLAMTMEFRMGRPLTVAPGQTHTIPIKSLRFGVRGISRQAYWTEPGEYTLTASFTTHPPNQSDQPTTIAAPAIKIQVKAAGKE